MFIPPGFGNVVFRFRRLGDNELMVTSLGIDWDGTTDGEQLVNDLFDTWVDSDMRAATPGSMWLNSVVLELGTIGPGNATYESNKAEAEGQSTDDLLPSNCALLIKKTTALGGRANRGRNYYPMATQQTTDDNGVIDTGAVADYTARWNDWMALIRGLDSVTDIFLLHSEDDTIPTPITSFQCQSKIATQRRRMRP